MARALCQRYRHGIPSEEKREERGMNFEFPKDVTLVYSNTRTLAFIQKGSDVVMIEENHFQDGLEELHLPIDALKILL